MSEDRTQLFISCRSFQVYANCDFGEINHQSLLTSYVFEKDSEGYAEYALPDIQGNLVLPTGIQHHAQFRDVLLHQAEDNPVIKLHL